MHHTNIKYWQEGKLGVDNMKTFCAVFELFYKSETVLKSKVYKNITILVLKIESYISYSAALDIELVSKYIDF